MRSLLTVCTASALIGALAAGLLLGSPRAPAETPIAQAAGDATGRIVVKFKQEAAMRANTDVLQLANAVEIGQLRQIGARLIGVPAGTERAVLSVLRASPLVEYAHSSARVEAQVMPSDPNSLDGSQWALAKMRVYQAWDISRGSPIRVAIVDTGISPTHPDLQGKVVEGLRILNGVVFPNEYADDNSHGTHVAGIVGAVTDNSIGVAGLNWQVQLLAVKVLYGGWGSDFDAAKGIVEAADRGAKVINCSFGGRVNESPPVDQQVLCDAVDYATGRGSLVVVAAGNNYPDAFYPAACTNALAVNSTGSSDSLSWFAYSHPYVDLAAPGEGIYSTVGTAGGTDSYYNKSGTSMSTPQVSGLASLIWSVIPFASRASVVQILQDTAVDLGASGWDPTFGWGRVDALTALQRAVALKCTLQHCVHFPLTARN